MGLKKNLFWKHTHLQAIQYVDGYPAVNGCRHNGSLNSRSQKHYNNWQVLLIVNVFWNKKLHVYEKHIHHGVNFKPLLLAKM